MKSLARKKAIAVACLLASNQSMAAGYFLESRPATPDLYTYVGASWRDPKDNRSHVERGHLEARLVTPKDLEFAVRGQTVREEWSDGDQSDIGDTYLSITKGIRPDRLWLDYASIEVGAALETAPRALTDDIDWYARGRLVGGPTLLGFDLSATTYNHSARQSGLGDTTLVTSAGARSQISNWHLGLDVEFSTRSGIEDGTAVSFVTMRRGVSGGAIYTIVSKGVSGSEDDLYFGVGVEFRFAPKMH
jgi:hypothetical protein